MTEPDADLSISDAAESGDRRDLLLALRRRLAAALEDPRTQPRDLSPIVLRLKELAVELEAFDDDEIDIAGRVPDEPFDPASI